jgi:hypothetical protein
LFTQAEGMSVLHETVYEDRFVYVPDGRGEDRREHRRGEESVGAAESR